MSQYIVHSENLVQKMKGKATDNDEIHYFNSLQKALKLRADKIKAGLKCTVYSKINIDSKPVVIK